MLYDNAQLVIAYLEAYQITGDESFARVASETLDYVLREMTDEAGAFHSATDADSATPSGHQEEGWFFTWTPDEIEEVVGPESAKLIRSHYGVSIRGNFERRNIFFISRPLARMAADSGKDEAALRSELDTAREQLYEARSHRPPPGKDDKVLTSWNGLMIEAFARAGRVLDEPRYEEAAATAAGFILTNLRLDDGRLARSWKDGRARHLAVLDDYAFLTAGLIELYQASADPRWLAAAIELTNTTIERFGDEQGGAFFFTAADAEELLIREKPDYDGAEPSGNSVAVGNLLKLYELTGNYDYRDQAERALRAQYSTLSRNPTAVPKMLAALDFYLDRPKQIVIVKPDDDADASAFLDRLATTFLPSSVVAVTAQGDAADELAKLVPLVKGKIARDGEITAYVCEQQVCELPTSDPEVFQGQIEKTEPYPPATPPLVAP